GRTIAQRYLLQQVLRDSPKGSVYKALDTRLGKSVVVKLLSPALRQYPGYREQFEREAEIAAKLSHAHICQVLDYGQDQLVIDARPTMVLFLCLPLLDGGNLESRGASTIPLEQIVTWTAQIAGALHYAHSLDVIHGDLKPSAICFDAS